MRATFLLGTTDTLLQALRRLVPGVNWLRALYLAQLNRHAEAITLLDEMLDGRRHIGTLDDYTWYWVDTIWLEAATLVGHQKAAEALLRQIEGSPRITGYYYTTCVPRHLGAAAALLDRPDEARNHYREAIKVCTEITFRPELALTRLQLAELLLQHYPEERAEALEHLDFAIAEFRDMKMQPSLERALKHKEILGA